MKNVKELDPPQLDPVVKNMMDWDWDEEYETLGCE